MHRRHRLRKSRDFSRVYDKGRSAAGRLLVLYALPSAGSVRVGVAAGKRLGGAVVRNRAKRIIRAAAHWVLPSVVEGHDLIIIARAGAVKAKTQDVQRELSRLLARLGLLRDGDGCCA